MDVAVVTMYVLKEQPAMIHTYDRDTMTLAHHTSAFVRRSRPSRAPYTGLRETFHALLNKRAAELSEGAYAKPSSRRTGTTGTNIAHASNLSRYNPLKDVANSTMGMALCRRCWRFCMALCMPSRSTKTV
jgi:hypothetical protein